jgi:hypothetical protein
VTQPGTPTPTLAVTPGHPGPTTVVTPPVTQPGTPTATLAVTPTRVGQPADVSEPVPVPPCTEEGSASHCPAGMVCALGANQQLGCRTVCETDANCAAGQRCTAAPRVNRNLCLVP